MTTPLKKKQLAAKKAIKEQLANETPIGKEKVVEMKTSPKKEEEVKPHPKMPLDQPEMKAMVIGNHLKTMLFDPMGYNVAIDFIRISTITRVSYNVVMDELVLVLPETTGRIGETDVPIKNNMGKKTGAYRKEIHGQITSFKSRLQEQDEIRKFLEVFLEESPLSEETFEGFKNHQIAKEVLEKAAALKQEEADGKKKTGLVDAHGNDIK